LDLQISPAGVLECRVFIESAPEHVDAVMAAREFSLGQETLSELSGGSESFAAVLNSRPKSWELLYDYGMGAVRLCRLDDAGRLVWDRGWPKQGAV
jgi:hypothetical protein